MRANPALVAQFFKDRFTHAGVVARWTLILAPMAVLVGASCALFLWSLDQATALRFQYPWLLFLLPVAGFAIGWVYLRIGGAAEGGNNLLVDQIHSPGGGVPFRMAPLILISTVLTHLFGGSAGREGTAVQMGGSLAAFIGRMWKLDSESLPVLLMAGIAAGFAAVFGTPIAGAIFAMEVLAVGRVQYRALVPCLGTALLADWTCQSLGIHHTLYTVTGHVGAFVDLVLLLKVAIAAVAFGLTSLVFSEANHMLGAWVKVQIRHAPLRPLIGGAVIIGLVYLCGTRDYLGLGVWSSDPGAVTLPGLFGAPIHDWSWALKILFTVVTLSFGFKGGEVTPLFFIGAALGNALSPTLGVPPDLLAALGFVAVFAGAANTPLACTLMGIELFGSTYGAYIAVACFISYLSSGHSGIYLSQRLAVPKTAWPAVPAMTALRDVRLSLTRAPKPAASPDAPSSQDQD